MPELFIPSSMRGASTAPEAPAARGRDAAGSAPSAGQFDFARTLQSRLDGRRPDETSAPRVSPSRHAERPAASSPRAADGPPRPAAGRPQSADAAEKAGDREAAPADAADRPAAAEPTDPAADAQGQADGVAPEGGAGDPPVVPIASPVVPQELAQALADAPAATPTAGDEPAEVTDHAAIDADDGRQPPAVVAAATVPPPAATAAQVPAQEAVAAAPAAQPAAAMVAANPKGKATAPEASQSDPAGDEGEAGAMPESELRPRPAAGETAGRQRPADIESAAAAAAQSRRPAAESTQRTTEATMRVVPPQAEAAALRSLEARSGLAADREGLLPAEGAPAASGGPGSLHGTASLARASAPAPTAFISTAAHQPGFADELGQRVLLFAGRGESRAELILTPAHLGRVEISLTVSAEQTTAQIVAANAAARDALEQALPRLREMLAQAGITLGESNVDTQSRGEAQDGRGRTAYRGAIALGTSDAAAASGPDQRTRGPGLIDTFA